MRIFRDLEGVGIIKNPVVTTGSFDGVHLGHKTILNRLNVLGRNLGGESTLITFHPHPRKVLYPETAGKDLQLINTQREKIYLLDKAGLDNLIIIQFTPEFAQTSSIDFIRKILVGQLHARCVVVGFNHHFGHNREGSYAYLHDLAEYYHFLVEEIPEQDIENETVSSTRIRKSLLEGKIQRANAYLDHLYIIMGILRPGQPEHLAAGFSCLDVEIEEDVKLIPPDGIYAVQVDGSNQTHKALAEIYTPEQGRQRQVALHFLEPWQLLPGHDVRVSFHKQIREGAYSLSSPLEGHIIHKDKQFIDELIY